MMMHMDTSFSQVQHILVDDQPSWSSLSPELNWTSISFEGSFKSTRRRLIVEPDNSVDSSGPWCDIPDEIAEASKKPFEIKALQLGHAERSMTPRITSRRLPKAYVQTMSGWQNETNLGHIPISLLSHCMRTKRGIFF
jgi:hypothetical protein